MSPVSGKSSATWRSSRGERVPAVAQRVVAPVLEERVGEQRVGDDAAAEPRGVDLVAPGAPDVPVVGHVVVVEDHVGGDVGERTADLRQPVEERRQRVHAAAVIAAVARVVAQDVQRLLQREARRPRDRSGIDVRRVAAKRVEPAVQVPDLRQRVRGGQRVEGVDALELRAGAVHLPDRVAPHREVHRAVLAERDQMVRDVGRRELRLALQDRPAAVGREVHEVRGPHVRRRAGDARVDGVRAVVEQRELALERGVADRVHGAVVLERCERVRRVLGDERLERGVARRRRDAQVGLLARRVVLRGIDRRQVLGLAQQPLAGAVEHRQHRPVDVVGVDLVAGQEQLVRAAVGVEAGLAAPLENQVVDERQRVVAPLAVRLVAVREPRPAAAAVQDLEVGQRGWRQREAGQLVDLVAEREVRLLVEDRLVLQQAERSQVSARPGWDRIEDGRGRRGVDVAVEVEVVRVVAARDQGKRGRLELHDHHREVQGAPDAQRVGGAGRQRRGADRRLLAAVVDDEPDGSRLVQRDPYGGEPRFYPPDDRSRQQDERYGCHRWASVRAPGAYVQWRVAR